MKDIKKQLKKRAPEGLNLFMIWDCWFTEDEYKVFKT